MRSKRTLVLLAAITVLAFATVIIWQAVLREDRHGLLTVTFLDVGQGDSIYIESPTGVQVLIDGGADSTVIRRLSEVMPWYDRSIDLVVGTHPDADHIGGLIDVFARYQAGAILQSSVLGTTATWNTFEKLARVETQNFSDTKRGQVIDLGGGSRLEILFPDRDVPNLETNTGCVVSRLVYGNTSFMLSCDAPKTIEYYLVELDGTKLKSDVLKPGHHGSKTSTSPLWVGYVNPKYAVFSRGCNNTYGFPHEETVETLKQFGVLIYDTCEERSVTFISDGQKVVKK